MNKALLILFLSVNLPCCAAVYDFLADTIDKSTVKTPFVNDNYDYSSTDAVVIPLRIEEKISTKDKNFHEGMSVNLRVRENVFYKNKIILKKNDIVKAKVGTHITSGMNGIPHSIIINNFDILQIDPSKLKSSYQKDGWNRTYLVLPLKWSLTFLPPTGSLTNFILGGHAKVTPKDEINVYYYPLWGRGESFVSQ